MLASLRERVNPPLPPAMASWTHGSSSLVPPLSSAGAGCGCFVADDAEILTALPSAWEVELVAAALGPRCHLLASSVLSPGATARPFTVGPKRRHKRAHHAHAQPHAHLSTHTYTWRVPKWPSLGKNGLSIDGAPHVLCPCFLSENQFLAYFADFRASIFCLSLVSFQFRFDPSQAQLGDHTRGGGWQAGFSLQLFPDSPNCPV